MRHWLAAGARGWRLDVADELPDEFIEQIRAAATAERPDALVLGEVWEDASNKVSYGKLRRYLLGRELDSAMNYPFRDAALGFLLGHVSAGAAAESLVSISENYPPEAQAAALNLLSSHDRPRLMSVLGGALDHPDWQPWPDGVPGRLTDGERGLAKGRFWLAVLMQMTYLGVPSVYYGDELGMEGLSDPYNRGPFPWASGDGGQHGEAVGHVAAGDADCQTMYRNVIQLRQSLPVLTSGGAHAFAPCDDVLGWWRLPAEGSGASACVLVNRSLSEWRDVSIEDRGMRASELIGAAELRRGDGRVSLALAPLGSAVVLFDDGEGLARPLEGGSGVVCHITSVPNGGRPGTLGAPARAFVDWLERTHQRYWQILPVNPTDGFGSPYAGTSVFAGNERLLELGPDELRARMEAFEPDAVYEEFMQANADWLDPYACFVAISELTGTDEWQTWPAEWRRWTPELLRDPRLADGIRFHRFAQWEFEWEWMDLRAYANARGHPHHRRHPHVRRGLLGRRLDRPRAVLRRRGRQAHAAGRNAARCVCQGRSAVGQPVLPLGRHARRRLCLVDAPPSRARSRCMTSRASTTSWASRTTTACRPAARRSRAPGMPAPASRCSAARTSFSASCPSSPRTWAR